MTLTAAHLKAIIPGIKQSVIETFLPHLNKYMPEYEINNRLRVAAFIPQVAHESIGFRYMREIWGPTKQQLRYERNFAHAWPPTASDEVNKLAYDLGNEFKGDGKKFSGHGAIQTTGRRNHKATSHALFGDDRLLTNPDILATPEYAVQSACWFWKSHGLNELADAYMFTMITENINGGHNGLAERKEYYSRALKAI